MHILFALQTLLSLWMLVDAARRGAGYVWYMIIMMPFGEIAYFFAVKIHDPEFAAIGHRLFYKPPSLDQIRYNAEHTPSFEHKLILARALHDAEQYDEAIARFQQLLDQDPEDKAALYGLGSSLLHAGQTGAAIAALEALSELDFKYDSHAAGSMLAKVYWHADRRDESIELMQSVVRSSRHLTHSTELARYLAESGRTQDARALLESCLREYEHSPGYVQKHDRPHARAARAALRSLR